MDTLWQDVRLALRTARGNPGFTSLVVLTLALGIGATCAIFTLLNATLLGSLPFREPDRVVLIRGEMRKDATPAEWPVGYQDLESLRAETKSFSALAQASSVRSFNLAADGEVEHITGELVGPDYFAALGMRPALGRFFTLDEARPPGAAQVVVLSHALWNRRFGADRSVLGKSIELNEQRYAVIGVASPGAAGLTDQAQVWLPIGLAHGVYGPHYTEMRQFRWMSGVARLRPGVTLAEAERDMEAASARMRTAFPVENEACSLRLTPLPELLFGDLRRPLFSLLAASGFVLLIACVNVANLLLARASARRREMAVRLAIGAVPGRIVRQLLTESVVVVIAAAVLALALGWWTTRLLASSGAVSLQSFQQVRLDPVVVTVTLVIAVACAVGFGMAPAWLASRVSPLEGLNESAKGATSGVKRRRFQDALVAAEVVLALTLLVGAGLMIKGIRQFLATDLGFAPERVLTLRMDLTAERWRDNERVWALARATVERVTGVPGVQSVALEGPGLPTSGYYAAHFTRGDDGSSTPTQYMSRRHHVTPGYFATLGIGFLGGRDFAMSDAGNTPRVAIISETYAKRIWPDGAAIGRQLRTIGNTPQLITVVGVVRDVSHAGLNAEATAMPDVYIPLLQSPPRSPSLVAMHVRSDGDPTRLAEPVSRAFRDVEQDLPLYDVRTLQSRIDEQTNAARTLVFLMSAFATLALVLAAIGIYGVIAYMVSQRTREIGIRSALGAQRGDVVRLMLGNGLRPVAIGAVLGLGGVFALNRFLTAFLYGVSPTDPATLAATSLVLFAAALAASLVPAWRATRISPMTALRSE